MANSDKDIVITPNRGSSTEDPKIVFSGADASTSAQTITLKAYPTNGGTISFEGSTGQLLSIANTMAGTIFSANDISGVPSIEVLDSGIIRLAPYSGQVAAGGTTVIGAAKLSVINGGSSAVSWNTGFSMGSTSNYTTWIQDAGVSRFRNQGGGGMDWYNAAGDTRILYLTNSGDLQAKRFVDIDNTSYYVDPAGTSVLNNLSVSGSINQWALGSERQYYLGSVGASATQARRVEVARVFIDYNDWHAAGTIFVELQNNYYYGGDWQKWAISYDYNAINCDLIEGNSPRGRAARVTTSSAVQISGDYYYISIYVDVRYYAQYHVYLRTSWPASSSPTASGQSGTIYVYSDPATTPGYTNISDFTPSYTVFSSNILATSDKMRADSFEEYGNSAYYIDPAGSSNIGRLIVNSADANGGIYMTSGGHAYVTVNRAATANGEVGFRYNTADSTRWWNYLATGDNNTLRWYSAAGADKMTLTQAGSLVAYSDMQAPVFYAKDATGYYLKPSSTTDALLINGHMKQGTLVARPYVAWGASGDSTGQVLIKFPGNSSNYGMIHAVIDIYEYSGNASSTITVGGHNWNGAWYNYNSDVVGYTNKQVRVGFHGGQYTIAIGSNGSVWSYGQVVLRKIQTGSYYTGIMDLSGSYTITLDSNAEAGFTWISGDLRQLRTPSTITASGYIYAPRFVDSDNNNYYVDPYSGSVLQGSITKNGFTMPFVALQDTAPSPQQNGDLWWESDTGRLKIYYNDGSSSQWVDASPSPDVSIYLPKAGGTVTGPLVSNSYFIASGYIQSDTAIRSERYVDTSNTFVYRVGNGSGRTRHLNLADTTSDPAGVGSNTGITWGQRSDNNPYYLIYTKDPYSNGYSTHSRLTLAWHTGIEIGAEAGYGGTRFFNNSPFTGTEIFSVGKGDSNVRVVNNIYAGIYYDNDTTYYLNANADRDSNINGFTTRTQAMLGLTYKYNYFRPVITGDTNYWVGSMGWGSYDFSSEIFHWGSGFIDGWGSTGAQGRPGDTSHHVGVQALHYTSGTDAYGWQAVGGVTDSWWWRHRWGGGSAGGGFSQWFKVAMYNNNANAGDFYATRYYASDATSWYVDPNDISNMYLIQGKLYTNTANYTGSDNPAIKTWSGVLCAGSDYSGATTYTYIRTKVSKDSYMMGGFTIQWFENYSSTNAKTTITLGGYWNPAANGGPIGWEYTSTNPNIRPTIHVGWDDNGYYMFRLTHYNSSYCQIVVRDLWIGYSGGSSDQGDSDHQGLSLGWRLQQSSSLNYYYVVAVQPRLAVAMDSISYMTAPIGRSSWASGGYFVGAQNNAGGTDTKTNPIYTIGTSHMPSDTGLGDMYGIGFSHSNFLGTIAQSGGWGLYVTSAGTARVYLSGENGSIVSTGAHHGDVYYQYTNTGYYFNPDATTSLNAYGRIYAGAAVRGGTYGAMNSSGFNTNVLGSANASYTGGGCGHPPWGGSPSFGGFINVNGGGLGATWSGNGANYYGGEPGGVYYGGNGDYTSGGGAGLVAIGGDGGYYAQAGAGIYARGGSNGYWYGVSAYGIYRAPAAYFDGNVHIMTPSGSTQCGLNIGYFNYTSNDNSTFLLKAAGPGYFSSYVDTDYARKSGDSGYYWNLNSSSNVSTTVTGAMYFRANRNTTSDSPPLQAYSNDGGGAIMSFHRSGQYAINFGLDSDNVIRFGGWSASANRLQMDMSGNLTMAGNVTAYSDIRLKENIEVISDALYKVKQIRGVTFTRNDAEDKEQRHAGVIAQEVELVLPEVVAEDNSGVKNVAYGNMVGLLVEAIKEQQAIIDSQEERLARLEALVKGVA